MERHQGTLYPGAARRDLLSCRRRPCSRSDTGSSCLPGRWAAPTRRGCSGSTRRRLSSVRSKKQRAERSAWTQQIDTMDFAAIKADPALMEDRARSRAHAFRRQLRGYATGRAAREARVSRTSPPAPGCGAAILRRVAETLRVGINSSHDETRVSQMMAFGRDATLDLAQIGDVRGLCAVARWIERNGRRFA